MTTTSGSDAERALMTFDDAKALASKAIYDTDGRGLVGAGRMHLTNRVARAILQAARSLPVEGVLGSGWLPIETAPRDGTLVDAWDGFERFTDVMWARPDCGLREPCWLKAEYERGYGWVNQRMHPQPSHYMPRPPPPQGGLDAGATGASLGGA